MGKGKQINREKIQKLNKGGEKKELYNVSQ